MVDSKKKTRVNIEFYTNSGFLPQALAKKYLAPGKTTQTLQKNPALANSNKKTLVYKLRS